MPAPKVLLLLDVQIVDLMPSGLTNLRFVRQVGACKGLEKKVAVLYKKAKRN